MARPDSHLTRVLQKVFPFLITHTRLFLESAEISELPILAEDQDDQVVEALSLFSPLPLDNPGAGPRSLGDVMRVLFSFEL
jgi:hypothetical protein